MVLNTREIIDIMSDLALHEDIKVIKAASFGVVAIAGATTLLGSVFLGPLGFIAARFFECLAVASTSTSLNYRPITEILLHDLTRAQQARLVNRVNDVIRNNIGVANVDTVTGLIASGHSLRGNLLNALKLFITSDLHYSLAE